MAESGSAEERTQDLAGMPKDAVGAIAVQEKQPASEPGSLAPSGKALLWLSLLIGTIVVGGACAMAAWGVGVEGAGVLGMKWYRGRGPTLYSFNSGFNIATALGAVGLLVAAGGEILSRSAVPRWPTRVVFAWFSWYFLAGIGGILLRRYQEIDLGMIEASGVLLSVQTAVVALPVYLLWQTQRVARWLWRAAKQRSMLAGVLIGASWALSGGVALALHLADGAPTQTADVTTGRGAFFRLIALAEDRPDLATADLVRAWLSTGQVSDGKRLSHQGSTAGTPALPMPDSVAGSLGENRLANCVETLAHPRESSYLTQGIRYLQSQSLGNGDAQDLAWETVLRVCMRHADNPISDLRSYYFRSLTNRKISNHRSPKSRWCLQEVPIYIYNDTELGLADLQRDVETAFCALPPTERTVIELRIGGESDAAIAARLGSSPTAVRQAASRGFRKLRDSLGLTP